jgi:adenylate kinase family enzyme
MTSIPQPRVLVLAGPNGAGKSTTSQQLVHDQLGIATSSMPTPLHAVSLRSSRREWPRRRPHHAASLA